MSIAFRSPVTAKLHPFNAPVPPKGEFRVTQRFSDLDSYWSRADPQRAKQQHGAVDIGNFRCDDPIVAMAAGTALRVQDNATAFGAKSNALGVLIEHGEGLQSGYWHLNRYSITRDGPVAAGQKIGELGSTGLGATCHCHITLRHNGKLIDPEPYMFGKAWGVIAKDEVDDVYEWVPLIQHAPPRMAIVSQGAVARKRPSHDAEEHYTFATGGTPEALVDRGIQVIGTVQDAPGYPAGLWYVGHRSGGKGLFLVANSQMDRIYDAPAAAGLPAGLRGDLDGAATAAGGILNAATALVDTLGRARSKVG